MVKNNDLLDVLQGFNHIIFILYTLELFPDLEYYLIWSRTFIEVYVHGPSQEIFSLSHIELHVFDEWGFAGSLFSINMNQVWFTLTQILYKLASFCLSSKVIHLWELKSFICIILDFPFLLILSNTVVLVLFITEKLKLHWLVMFHVLVSTTT